jgi:hypothetical protein
MELFVKAISAFIGFFTGIIAGAIGSYFLLWNAGEFLFGYQGDAIQPIFNVFSVFIAVVAGIAGAAMGAEFGNRLTDSPGNNTNRPPLPPPPPKPPITLD